MAKIKFKAIIKAPSEYQIGELPANAVKMNMPNSIGAMMLKSLPFGVLLIAITLGCLFAKAFICNYAVVNPLFILIGLAVGFLLLLVHELLHAIVYPNEATVYVGFSPKNFAFLALASYPLKRWRFIVMSLLPFILGIVPLVCFVCFPYTWVEANSILFGLALMGMISPYPDCYNVLQALKQAPRGSYIQFYGDEIYYFIKDESL